MTVLLSALIIIFIISGFLSGVIAIFMESSKFFIEPLVFLILLCVCICMLSLTNENPSKLYQEKVDAVKKANKELEKFLIDYPEFREE